MVRAMARDLKLGLGTGYWSAGPPGRAMEAITAADELGFDSMWAAEAYGSDALTPLAWWGSQTKNLKLGTSIVQISARQPAATAMAAMTLDHLSGGRMILGLGVSGPQVVEGWYGMEFAKPLARTREYVSIVRDIVARKDRVTAPGPAYPLPYPGGTGLGKPLKSTLHPVREDIPIYLAAEGPKNIALAAEIADGWLGLFYSPHHEDLYKPQLQEGFGRDGARRSWDDFEIATSVPIVIDDDIERAADTLRPMYALYFGGMGARDANFHANVPVRMGYGDLVDTLKDLYLSGKKDEAAAAIPVELIEKMALIGPADKIRHDLDAWRDSIVTTMLVSGDAEQVRRIADLVLG
jgi:F420-dependent oxidoreductase-like protein